MATAYQAVHAYHARTFPARQYMAGAYQAVHAYHAHTLHAYPALGVL